MQLDPSNSMHYDIACALRGPDWTEDAAHGLKYLFTGRLRAVVGANAGVTRVVPATPEDVRLALAEARQLPREMIGHYLHHVMTAAFALGLSGLGAAAQRMMDAADSFVEIALLHEVNADFEQPGGPSRGGPGGPLAQAAPGASASVSSPGASIHDNRI